MLTFSIKKVSFHGRYSDFSFINQSYPQNSHNKKLIKPPKDGIKKPLTLKSHSFVSIFDWMMEIAAIMKLTRPTFYRACNIFYETSKKDPKIMQNSNVEKYACGSILISAKLQKSNMDYLGQLYHINKKRISKQVITMIEISIYQILQWKLPLYNLVSEQVLQVITKWNNFLQKRQKLNKIKKDTRERFSVSLEYSQGQPAKNKTYGEILYLLDMIVLNQTKKYMNGISLGEIEQTKNKQLFMTPIVIAMYSVLTVQLGDTENRQQYLIPLFKQFYRQQLQMPLTQIDRMHKQIQISFMLFNFAQHLRKISLTKDWKQVIQNDLQTYLPIKVIHKTEIK